MGKTTDAETRYTSIQFSFLLYIYFDNYFLQNGTPTNNESSTIAPIATDNPLSQPSNIKENSKRQATPTPFSRTPDVPDVPSRQHTTGLNLPGDLTQFNYDDHWREIEIDLQRVNIEKKRFFFFSVIYIFTYKILIKLVSWCWFGIFNSWWYRYTMY